MISHDARETSGARLASVANVRAWLDRTWEAREAIGRALLGVIEATVILASFGWTLAGLVGYGQKTGWSMEGLLTLVDAKWRGALIQRSRARAPSRTCCQGIATTAPESISAVRRSSASAQASSQSGSGPSTLAMSREARANRSAGARAKTNRSKSDGSLGCAMSYDCTATFRGIALEIGGETHGPAGSRFPDP